MNYKIITLRLTQILLIAVCMLRELINTLTDIGQYSKNLSLFSKITTFPSQDRAGILFDRSVSGSLVNFLGPISLVAAHAIVFFFLLYGIIILIKNITDKDFKRYNSKKFICTIGLVLGLIQYYFFYGFLAMDYFLSWMQQINYNGDIVGYSLPLLASLLYLNANDFKELLSN